MVGGVFHTIGDAFVAVVVVGLMRRGVVMVEVGWDMVSVDVVGVGCSCAGVVIVTAGCSYMVGVW